MFHSTIFLCLNHVRIYIVGTSRSQRPCPRFGDWYPTLRISLGSLYLFVLGAGTRALQHVGLMLSGVRANLTYKFTLTRIYRYSLNILPRTWSFKVSRCPL